MNHGIVKTFAKRLDAHNISDFHGLISPGLTCYLNSVLQVLFMTEEFRDRIKSQDVGILDQHLKELFTTLEKNTTKTEVIAHKLGIGDVYEQRDAAEYFEKILRSINQKSSEIFKGELKHVTKCCKCEKRNVARGSFWIMPLSIKNPNQIYRVDKGLEDFFREEIVNGENNIYCNQCDEKQEALIVCELTKPPEVLTLLLKRFHYDSELKCDVKLNCEAKVPLMLQIKDCTYDLYAMVKHYGNLSGGHYIVYIYSIQTKAWYSFDDKRVKLINFLASGQTSLRSHSAYLLMYTRRGDSENATENNEEALNLNGEAETLTEACKKREKGGQEDFLMMSDKKTGTCKDTIRAPSSKSHGRTNSVLNSAGSFLLRQESSSRTKRLNKVDTDYSQKGLYRNDYKVDKYSSQICKRADRTAVLQDKAKTKSVWKY